jgi:hypothetical protein
MTLESDYDLAVCVLSRPQTIFGAAQTLRDVLALIHGVALGRFPPHGYGFLPGFPAFVERRFNGPSRNHNEILLEQFGHMPGLEGCEPVLSLLREWKSAAKESGRA